MTESRHLAPHQGRALQKLGEWWASKAKSRANGFLCMPTGSGKTYTAVRFAVTQILAEHKREPSVLWVAHSEFLLNQAEREFKTQLKSAGLGTQIKMARVRGDGDGADANVMLATIQTLARRGAIAAIQEFDLDLVIFDEFHHLAAESWSKVPGKFHSDGVRTLGLSATPFRRNPKQGHVLRKLFPTRIFSVGLTELIRSKFLASPALQRVTFKPKRSLRFTQDELSHFRQFKRLGEATLQRIADQSGRDQLIIDTYTKAPQKYGNTIVFCCSVSHAEALAAAFNQNGISAQAICGSSKDEENRKALAAFRRGKFQVVTSVVLLVEGVDVPSCSSVFLARPTESPILLTQMVGRAMRGPEAGGGATCQIVDFVDVLENRWDLSASRFAILGDYDEAVRHLVRRKPRRKDDGVSAALILRLRELLNAHFVQNGGVENFGEILKNDIVGWLEHWDGEMNRVLIIPNAEIGGQVIEELAIIKSNATTFDEAADLAHAAYDKHEFHEGHINEEDFVNLATAAVVDGEEVGFHSLPEMVDSPKKSDALVKSLVSLGAEFAAAGPPNQAASSITSSATCAALTRAALAFETRTAA